MTDKASQRFGDLAGESVAAAKVRSIKRSNHSELADEDHVRHALKVMEDGLASDHERFFADLESRVIDEPSSSAS